MTCGKEQDAAYTWRIKQHQECAHKETGVLLLQVIDYAVEQPPGLESHNKRTGAARANRIGDWYETNKENWLSFLAISWALNRRDKRASGPDQPSSRFRPPGWLIVLYGNGTPLFRVRAQEKNRSQYGPRHPGYGASCGPDRQGNRGS